MVDKLVKLLWPKTVDIHDDEQLKYCIFLNVKIAVSFKL